jgi:hypothetical protein
MQMNNAICLAALTVLFSACATDYYTYSGSQIYQGQGGASKRINGVDLWIVGTPLRKYYIIGYITDSRPGGPIPMARRNSDMAEKAKQHGGDAIIPSSDVQNVLGSATYGTGSAVVNGNTVTASGTSVSLPLIRREGTYYVIKYAD